uniref:Uncharacterized protein n=1 Tax=Octopus bimaculoides TaxID=37653 RepID=A0A0L8H379_OCTBM
MLFSFYKQHCLQYHSFPSILSPRVISPHGTRQSSQVNLFLISRRRAHHSNILYLELLLKSQIFHFSSNINSRVRISFSATIRCCAAGLPRDIFDFSQETMIFNHVCDLYINS